MSTVERWGLGDILMERVPSGEEIGACLSRAFDLRPGELFLFDEIEQVLEQPASTRLVCQRSFRDGEDYPLLLSLWGTVVQARPFASLVAELCKDFGCRCLIDDGSADPYSWLLLDGEGKSQVVSYHGP